jgi:hypothetical protein
MSISATLGGFSSNLLLLSAFLLLWSLVDMAATGIMKAITLVLIYAEPF